MLMLTAVVWGCGVAPALRGGEMEAQAVVHIFHGDLEVPGERRPSGTGFLVREGIVATAAHVVKSGEVIDVKFGDPYGEASNFRPAKVVTLDQEKDVALLWVDMGQAPLKVDVAIAKLSADQVGMGEPIAVYGFPESEIVGYEMRRSSGTVSAIRKNSPGREEGEEMLEIEARIEPGNSGSPVFGRSGEVIGLVSSRWKTTDTYALAVPIKVVEALLRDRYQDDRARVVEEITGIPEAYTEQIEEGLALTDALLSTAGVEGVARRELERLLVCMGRGERAGREGSLLLSRGDVIGAWRHLQVLQHEVESHRHDLEAMRSARKAMELLK